MNRLQKVNMAAARMEQAATELLYAAEILDHDRQEGSSRFDVQRHRNGLFRAARVYASKVNALSRIRK
jgi:hypothetical protein